MTLSALVEVATWWAVAVGVWLCTLSAPSGAELGIATAAALPCAVAAALGRRAMRASWRPDPRWLSWLTPLPIAVLVDSAAVLTLPVRRWRRRGAGVGEFREVRLPSGECRERAVARRALATAVISATPATFVVDSRPRGNALLVHELVPGAPAMRKVVAR